MKQWSLIWILLDLPRLTCKNKKRKREKVLSLSLSLSPFFLVFFRTNKLELFSWGFYQSWAISFLSSALSPPLFFVSIAMAENGEIPGNQAIVLNVKESEANHNIPSSSAPKTNHGGGCCVSVPFLQKVLLLIFMLMITNLFDSFLIRYKSYYLTQFNMKKGKFLLLMTVGGRGVGHILLDICRLWVGGGEFELWKGGDCAGNINSLGPCCDGSGLLSWPHLRRPFQSCGHHCLCHLQEISMEAGKLPQRNFLITLPLSFHRNILNSVYSSTLF